ncbi:hypothetical protein AA309_02880 [Microvirga vignae]|uniref:Uncharacterized protein n=1 Tax=Microvirga vignae TaxID=1225564 RepID=A0A0H1RHJ3_9HYPH|nr:hypothetical protein AA309_02880 [Microvirga vignae]
MRERARQLIFYLCGVAGINENHISDLDRHSAHRSMSRRFKTLKKCRFLLSHDQWEHSRAIIIETNMRWPPHLR